ncbi:hypothetical protein A2631_04730 [Candidatus Daviesbacteria bacterium RIFCSPHIGHO2_01_FULL_44_29]|uniref:DUF2130 domain-containing protein n=1 Tax=Candidatus Daviesbacteria bacterium RIFCSPHIGHO2_02_FULL_43_12 TaxID=1797776 RepID=A0A1F5KGG8_9BACT|nr:MAG: hypothetical protein A2631_04730 [Candidatus Daviesbacteria bacterium RIFCSPHIGHO2_01_FULL_44_29]OGE40026.1 MAG: hypothetical protein A3D25_04460 [Candidatus Daviesbacteria bacterium RIFCSPHIGHO2_02_FULL_43_12]OGE41491.1 MAG: hypothetical protein A3E86_05350 [Candidatus Daviesbacteria bacterium RIFCSPHIGHO2_12_FULL_47_45]OGE70293.1 MAG: hypothetical protein A3B55_01110 [Candidatus Daviesbacteria bacterium RIFCSPLOWO2_01_FULL_43_15]
MSVSSIQCPKCHTQISVDEVLRHQIEESVKGDLRDEYNQKYISLKLQLSEQSQKEKLELQEQLSKNKKEIETFRENELILRKKAQELEEKEKNLELEMQRQIDEERKKIQEKTETEVTEKFHLKEKEKDQLIESLKKSLDEAQRKASVGSQQLQGEVMELELMEILKREFPIDELSEVGKGVRGADLVQLVKDQIGRDAGKIIWESKRTKAFTEEWIVKLKEDMREAKADVSVIVSTILPSGAKFFTQKDGVYITSFDCVLQVAFILRKSLLDIAQTKALSVGKNEKIESLYRYITSSEFAQRIDSMLETYSKMQQTLDKEKMVMQKIWAQRDKEIERLKNNTLSMHGSLSGLIDEPMADIKSLEFEEIELVIEDPQTDGNL